MLTVEQLKELEAKYTRIAHVKGKGGAWEVVYRKPTRAEYKKLRAEASQPDANEKFARVLAVYPDKEGFDALLEEYPGAAEASSPALLELSGLAAEQEGK